MHSAPFSPRVADENGHTRGQGGDARFEILRFGHRPDFLFIGEQYVDRAIVEQGVEIGAIAFDDEHVRQGEGNFSFGLARCWKWRASSPCAVLRDPKD